MANRKIGSELSELVEENKRLRVDLEQGILNYWLRSLIDH